MGVADFPNSASPIGQADTKGVRMRVEKIGGMVPNRRRSRNSPIKESQATSLLVDLVEWDLLIVYPPSQNQAAAFLFDLSPVTAYHYHIGDNTREG